MCENNVLVILKECSFGVRGSIHGCGRGGGGGGGVGWALWSYNEMAFNNIIFYL